MSNDSDGEDNAMDVDGVVQFEKPEDPQEAGDLDADNIGDLEAALDVEAAEEKEHSEEACPEADPTYYMQVLEQRAEVASCRTNCNL